MTTQPCRRRFRDVGGSVFGLLLAVADAQQPAQWTLAHGITERGTRLVWDSARRRLVVFGGEALMAPVDLGDTWELSGAHWTERRTTTSPPPLAYHALCYDEVRRQVVLFGGLSSVIGVSDQTWLWNGADWTRANPVVVPPRRTEHAMAWLPARQRIVMFGGGNTPTGLSADTWEWDGAAWVEAFPPTSPSAREGHAMAQDPSGTRVILFGGSDTPTQNWLADHWEWDGSQWTARTLAQSPSARGLHGLAIDHRRQRTVLFGGRGAGGRLGDVWDWDGASWLQTLPSNPTMARQRGGLSWDGVRQCVALFGGETNQGGGADAWDWDGTTWTRRTPVPPRRVENAAMSDGLGLPVLCFGGNPYGSTNETWEWRDGGWVDRSTLAGPMLRSAAALAAEPIRGRVVLFGGMLSAALGDTWEWDGVRWLVQVPPLSPPPRYDHAMAFDWAQGQVLLFGGLDGLLPFRALADTWEWDGLQWHQRQPQHSPTARRAHAMASDLIRNRVVLFGGADRTTFGDTWEWDGVDWIWQPTAVAPAPTYEHTLVFDLLRARTVKYGGYPLQSDTWEWDGATWLQVSSAGGPGPSERHAAAYDLASHQMVLRGGGRTWRYGPSTSPSSQVLGSGCTGTAGVPQLASDLPFLGNEQFTIELIGARPGAPAVVGLDSMAQAVSIGGGCTVYLQQPSPSFVVTDGNGLAAVRGRVPYHVALRGMRLFAQGAVLDPLNGAGVAFTAGLELVVGD